MIHIISFFAFFTILSHVGVLFEWSFRTLANLSFLPIIGSILLYFLLRKVNYQFPIDKEKINKNKSDYIYLFIAIAGILFVGLFVLRISHDETFYLSIEKHALQNPDLPYLKYDGMLGEKDILLLMKSYSVQSYQMLSAVTSYWLGLDGLTDIKPRYTLFHIFGVIFFISSWIKLFKLFTPEKWQLSIFILFLIILADRGFLRYNSIMRFYDGKMILLYILIPLVLYYSILFFRRPHIISWLYLFLIQVASVGLSSSALFLVPLQSLIMGLCFYKPNKARTVNCFLFGTSAFYVAIVALIMKIAISDIALHDDFSPVPNDSLYVHKLSRNIMYGVFSIGFACIIPMISVLMAYRYYPAKSDLRRVLALLPIIVAITLSPIIYKHILAYIVPVTVVYRVLYIVIIQLFVVILLVNLTAKVSEQFRNGEIKNNWNNLMALCALCSIIFIPLLPRGWDQSFHDQYIQFGVSNLTKSRLDSPEVKEIAKKIIAQTPKGKRILASFPISPWLAGHSSAKIVAPLADIRNGNNYLIQLKHNFSKEEFKMRHELQKMLAGQDIPKEEQLSQWLKKLNVGSITYQNFPYWNEKFYQEKVAFPKEKLDYILIKNGYKKTFLHPDYNFWVIAQNN